MSELADALTENDGTAVKQITAASYAGAKELFEISVPAMHQMFDAMSNAPGCVGCRQAGAGFGGCMIALVESDGVDDFCSDVANEYKAATGIKPDIYAVQTAPGAGNLSLRIKAGCRWGKRSRIAKHQSTPHPTVQ